MTDTLDFSGRTALVTGAASGIGAACARWLDRHGAAHLVLVDTDADGLAALDLACSADRVTGSVADPELWTRLEAGWHRLDHAVVNAGIGGSGEIADLTLDEWRRVMSVNCDGAFLTLAAALRAMKRTGGGSAVVTASVTGLKPVPGIGPYGVAKAGVAHMARIAAAENAKHGIRVNAIAPGGVDTAIWEGGPQFLLSVAEHGREATLKAMAATTPRGQFATPDEIAGEIGFLLSDMAANVTGHVWVSDGGYSF
jgi:NAD(P)-dependent dehydrogenase (short-subunit alcohol dehydrogenase family)